MRSKEALIKKIGSNFLSFLKRMSVNQRKNCKKDTSLPTNTIHHKN